MSDGRLRLPGYPRCTSPPDWVRFCLEFQELKSAVSRWQSAVMNVASVAAMSWLSVYLLHRTKLTSTLRFSHSTVVRGSCRLKGQMKLDMATDAPTRASSTALPAVCPK